MEQIIQEISAKSDLAKIIIHSVPDIPGSASKIFSILGEAGFNVETITQISTRKNYCDIAFTIQESETTRVIEYLQMKLRDLRPTDFDIDKDVALITLFGPKIASTPGIAGKVFKIVSELGVNIENISASLMMISFLVPKHKVEPVIQALRQEFAA
ncbi:MAG: ACT domain-containing protein [candidate division WOR-3 bacterium]